MVRNKRKTFKDKLVEALVKRATITLTCEPEDLVIEGNAIASGEPDVDRAEEERIRNEMNDGNEWAWCCAHVRASFAGFHGDDYLGACSYANEKDFRDDVYYKQMVDDACADLADQLIAAKVAISDLLTRRTRHA